jgi:hypothetical protein
MKPEIRLLLVANNSRWKSWPKQIKKLQEWFAPRLTLKVDIKHTDFSAVPFTHYSDGDIPGAEGVERGWYDKNVTSLAVGYDMVMFVVNTSQWRLTNRARGWRTDRDDGPVELQVGADEKESMRWPNFKSMSAFFQIARHEVCHALYMMTGQIDNTHKYWDMGKLELVLDELDLSEKVVIKQKLWLLAALQRLLAKLTIKPMTNREKILSVAKAKLGTDFTNDQIVPDEVSCAYAVSLILRECDPTFPILPSTTDLWRHFQNNATKWERVYSPEAGDIIISPTGTNSKPGVMPNGHTGIYADYFNIMSNSSVTTTATTKGLWEVNFTRESWRDRYYYKGGYPVYLYRRKE